VTQGELIVIEILGERNKANMLTKALVESKLVNTVASVLEKGMISARRNIGKYADSIVMCEEEVNRVGGPGWQHSHRSNNLGYMSELKIL
jgi:hypothetical protein